MSRLLRWLLPVLALLLVGGLAARSIKARQLHNEAALAAAKVPPSLDLSPADVMLARSLDMARTVSVSGGLKAVNTAVVKAKVAAEVKSLAVREGDTVHAGQIIGQLDTAELDWRLRQAQQNAAAAQAQYEIARRTLENNRALVAQGFISPTGLETSVSNAETAHANHEAAAAAVALARKARADAVLVAPITGQVSQRAVQPGERAAVDARIVEIVDLAHIELEAALAPDDVGDVRVGQRAQLVIDGLAQPATATVVRINPSTQPGTRADMVYLAVHEQPGLRQGLFAQGHIELKRRTALAVPTSAVRVDQARPYLLTVQEGKVVHRPVVIGGRGEASVDGAAEPVVEILQGVTPGTPVLRAATGRLPEGTPVRLPAPAPASAAASAKAV
jgi:RND family efflux transporter MFP subunit